MSKTTIWKFDVPVTDRPEVTMPNGAVILPTVEEADSITLNVWAVVQPGVERVTRRLFVVGTGNPLPDGDMGEYVGTAKMSHGLVFHVFDDPEVGL